MMRVYRDCVPATTEKALYNAKYSPYTASMKLWHILVAFTVMLFSCNRGPSTPLAKAAVDGDTRAVKQLLLGANKHDLQDALIAAARAGSGAAIPVLVTAGADVNGRWGVNNWSPLQHAIHKGQSQSVASLLGAGADVNSRDQHNRTALMMAAGYGMANIAATLLKNGADATIQDEDGATALDFAITGVADIDDFTLGHCNPEIVRTLLDAAPALALSERSWRSAAAAGRCEDVQAVMKEKRAVLQRMAAGRS